MNLEIRNSISLRPKVRNLDGDEGALAFGFPNSNFVIQQRAFTLLELLLAILVFSIVLGAIHVVFFSALKLRDKTSAAIERGLPLQQTLAILQRDLANLAAPGGDLTGSLQSTPTASPATSGGRNHPVGPQFYTTTGLLHDTASWSEFQRVSYYLALPTNDVPGMELHRSIERELLAVTPETPQEQFLMGGVEDIKFQYYDGNAWKDTWDSTLPDNVTGLTNQLPKAVKVELTMYNDNPTLGLPAPVELIVPITVVTRTNAAVAIGGGVP